MALRSPAAQMIVWAAAILLFGFGDTFSSMLVFRQGGREANALLGSALGLLGASAWTFVLVKAAAIALVIVLARLWRRVEGWASLGMLFVGLFLVVHNATVLVALKGR